MFAILRAWLDRGLMRPSPGEALALCHALPNLASESPAELWWEALRRLVAVAGSDHGPLENDPWAQQVLAGELPLTLAYLFPELTPCRDLAEPARRALSAGPVELLDGEGLLHGRHWTVFRPLFACWTRCLAMGTRVAGGCWSEEAQVQFEWFVRQAVRLARRDGTQALSSGPEGAWCEGLFAAALRLGGDPTDHRLIERALPKPKKDKKERTGGQSPRKKRPRAVEKLPPAALHSEWAAAAVLRIGWQRRDPWLAVIYPGRCVQTELHTGSGVLWSGPWDLEVQVNGQPASPHSDWEEICWVSDDDVDYVELEAEWTGGLRVQRHLMLARKDRFLLLADAILGTAPAKLEYCGRLPLRQEVAFQQAEETWEGVLSVPGAGRSGPRVPAVILPLALPEWRCDPRPGFLGQTPRGLELRQTGQGSCLFAPLFVNLQPSRAVKPWTWRQLTVGENLAAQPADVAVGYRVMLDKQQWLIYRALSRKGNRTLLGHNLATEMLVARFLRNGEIEPLVEIE